jgi:hypothetical protein
VRLACAAAALLVGGGALAWLWTGRPVMAGLFLFLLLLTFVIRPALRQLGRSPGARPPPFIWRRDGPSAR